MVEALDDDWWTDTVGTKDDSSSNEEFEAESNEHSKVVRETKKRKLEDVVGQDAKPTKKKKKKKTAGKEVETNYISADDSKHMTKKKKKQNNDISGTSPEVNASETTETKKRKKKTITDVLAKEEKKPLTYENLILAIKKHYKDKLTTLEWDEVELQENNFTTCNDLSHTANSFFKAILPKWKKLKTKMSHDAGAPLVLVICSAAIRAANMTRLIADFKGEDCKIAKLFAKHFKLEEQTKYLKKTKIHIGVGTPNRIKSLLENGSLKLTQLECIVLDWSWRDCKQKRLIDIPQIKDELFHLLKDHLIPCVKKQKTRFGLF